MCKLRSGHNDQTLYLGTPDALINRHYYIPYASDDLTFPGKQ